MNTYLEKNVIQIDNLKKGDKYKCLKYFKIPSL